MLRHGPPLAMNGYMDKEGRKLRGRKTRYFKLRDSALFNHRRKDTPATWGVSLIDSRVAVGHKGEVIVQLFDGKKILVFPHSRAESDRWVDLLQRASARKIGNYYGVTGLIGMGSFAEVRIGYDKASGDQVAIKVMKKNKRDTELMRSVECEMNFISKNIDHENIVKTYDVFDTRDNLFIVMEYMPGGMLYDILATEGQFSEKHAACIMRDLLEAVQCLHANDIVHRDIKPENVLAVNKELPLRVKLADFGLADFVLENSFGEKSTCGMYGTPFFVAPEVIRAETYTPAVDIWSLGVLAYNMLSGKLPFDGSNIKEVLRRVRSGRYTFPDEEWSQISSEAKAFISGLLELDPHNRLTASQALSHPWLNNDQLSERAIANDLSALSHEQRKLRMSSMAIDDVAALLDMDDDDDDEGVDGVHGHEVDSSNNLKALVRLFPGRTSSAKAPSTRSSAAPSPSNSLGRSALSQGRSSGAQSDRGRPPTGRPPAAGGSNGSSGSSRGKTKMSAAAIKQAKMAPLVAQSTSSTTPPLRYNNDLLPPLHPLMASGSLSASVNSLSPDDMEPFSTGTHGYNFGRPRTAEKSNEVPAARASGGSSQGSAATATGSAVTANSAERGDRRTGGGAKQMEGVNQPGGTDADARQKNLAPRQPSDGLGLPDLAYGRQQSFGQEHDTSGYERQSFGAFQANPGFALPAIVSVKEIRRQKEAAAAAALAAASGAAPPKAQAGYASAQGYKGTQLIDDDSDDDDFGASMFSVKPRAAT